MYLLVKKCTGFSSKVKVKRKKKKEKEKEKENLPGLI